jgi:hypothetical protein
MIAGAYGVTVYHVAEENSSVTHLASMSHIHYNLNGRFNELLTTDDGDSHTLNDVCGILHTTIYSFLTALTYTMHIMILEPVDVRIE